MATLEARLTAAFQAVRDKFNDIAPRLLATGGAADQVYTKTSGGHAWVNPPRGLTGFCSGKPAANEVVTGGVAPYAMTLDEVRCAATAVVAAAASTTFLVKRNGTQIGTIVFPAAGTAGVVDITSTAVTAGQLLTIMAPVTPDATLADISFLLRE